MAYEIGYEGQCGTCKYYYFEGKYSKGPCTENSWHTYYYYPDHRCENYEDERDVHGGCFLTTACCQYKGLPDKCSELETMRGFRDNCLMQLEYGPEIKNLYYADAPKILAAMEDFSENEKKTIFEGIYTEINHINDLIDKGEEKDAIINYMLMVYKLARETLWVHNQNSVSAADK